MLPTINKNNAMFYINLFAIHQQRAPYAIQLSYVFVRKKKAPQILLIKQSETNKL